MQTQGKIKEINLDWKTNKTLVTLFVDSEPQFIEELSGKELSVELKIARGKRSLDANAYFHVLCDKIRQKLKISMSACKNELITSYGQIWYLDDENMDAWVYKTNAPPEFVRELEEPHMKLVKQGEDGAYWYRVYRGSHTYDTAEMSLLIDGTVQECKEQGIETMTPDELERMMKLYEEHHSK